MIDATEWMHDAMRGALRIADADMGEGERGSEDQQYGGWRSQHPRCSLIAAAPSCGGSGAAPSSNSAHAGSRSLSSGTCLQARHARFCGLRKRRGHRVSTFKAIRIDKTDTGTRAEYGDFDEKELMDGDVTVAVTHSTVNYKDGLAITGKSPVVRRFPMIPGIDFAGTVEASSHPAYKPGDQVILNGWGVGETHLGGYAKKARVKGDWLVPLPKGLSAAEAMAIGTAGYTAGLALLALEGHGANGRG